MPLREMVSMPGLPADPERAQRLYRQAESFFSYMHRYRRVDIRRYVEAFSARRGLLTEAEALAVFEDVIGDPDVFQRRWLAWAVGRTR